MVARTELGRAERVVIAGHIDTVPLAGNLPSRAEGDLLYGCGTSDMKSGVAVALKLAAGVPSPVRDVTYVFYDCEEVEAVLGHEVSHIANGDMVTLTLIQGVVNTFVVFLSRVVGYLVDRAVFKTERGVGMGYYITVMVCEIMFGVLASIIVAWFSRQREFRADAGAARLMGRKQPMINALHRLGGMHPGTLPQSMQAMGITGGLGKLFSSHPPIEERVAALQNNPVQ